MPNFAPFLLYVIVTTFTPGPNNILSMTNAVRYGYKRTLPFLLGVVCGFFVLMLLSGLLNVGLAGWIPAIKTWLHWLGAAYLVYLAIHILRSKPIEEGGKQDALSTFRAGVVLQFLNVKGILFGVTVYSLFIVDAYQDAASIALFAVFLSVVVFAAISTWALGGNLFRNFLRRHTRAFNVVMAGLLLYIAAASLLA